MWSIGDILDIVKEGIPSADLSSIKIGNFHNQIHTSSSSTVSINYDDYIDITAMFNVDLPLDKLRDISMMTAGDMSPLFQHLVHPELQKDGNMVYFNPVNCLFEIANNTIKLSLTVQLKGNRIAETARAVRDSNFYGLLEAALAD